MHLVMYYQEVDTSIKTSFSKSIIAADLDPKPLHSLFPLIPMLFIAPAVGKQLNHCLFVFFR